MESDDGDVPAKIASLSKDEMRKRLKITKYPQISVFHSFDSYVSALVSHIDTLQNQGVDDYEIAIHLNDDLMAGVLGPGYAVHSRKMESISLDGVLEAVKACDKESSLLTGSEKFHAIVQGQGESRFSLMKRIENAFLDYQIGDPSDHRAKLRIIKKQFCIAASLPQQVIDNVRHCQDLDDVVICANEDLAKMETEQKQRPDVQALSGFSKAGCPNSQMPRVTHAGDILAVTAVRPSPDPSLSRAPSGYEYDRANREVLVCLRCRLVNQHKANFCPYEKFCSYCQQENHTDLEHMNVAKAMGAKPNSGHCAAEQQQVAA